MQRYFVDFNENEKYFKITGDDFHHIKNVMRMKINDEIYVSNQTVVFYAKISDIDADYVLCEILSQVKTNSELPIKISIAQGLPKADKFEFVIQKLTELGVSEIIPVLSERSIIKLDNKKEDKKLTRYNKIAKEAAEQSHRVKIPNITEIMSVKELIKYSENYKYKLFAYEASNETDLIYFKHVLKEIKTNENILVFIGPEGGISEKEVELFKNNEFRVISLGKRILRTETAPLYVASVISYELETRG
ncbi:MAG: rRNA ((1498)-N(3))-methyltransferase [Haloplasmataceae bacterium]|jgi:16S rRNA (uracil1498-N3)-methyltransferase|nr:rRNA ((1498)-N(3))-methyltransferase [Haloplasmataceae bacterium]